MDAWTYGEQMHSRDLMEQRWRDQTLAGMYDAQMIAIAELADDRTIRCSPSKETNNFRNSRPVRR